MAKKFNPAPGWPEAPEGWLPPDGWQPDPSWPPAPDGWEIVVDEGDGKPGFRERARIRAEKAKERMEQIDEKAAAARAQYAQKRAEQASVSTDGALFVGESKDEGRNAIVTLYRDRIERVKPRSLGSFSRAAQDAEVTPMKAVSSVQVTKDGMKSKVLVYASGNTIEFRMQHQEAHKFRDEIMRLVLAGPESTPPAAPDPGGQPDYLEQLRKLGELRDAGILSDEEFAAKKADILARM